MSASAGETIAPPDGYRPLGWPHGFGVTIGPLFKRPKDGGGEVLGFRVAARHANLMDNCHGGMLLSFADMAFGRVITVVEKIGWVTVRLNCDFLSSARLGDWVEGTSEITSQEDDFYIVTGRIWCGDRLLMTGSGVFKGLRSLSEEMTGVVATMQTS